MRNVKISAKGYILRRENMNEDDVRTEKINFTCETETKQYLRLWAAKEGRTLSNLVERIILDAIERDKQSGGDK
ncbi:MAG: hypothetical protein KME55_37515 [Nostoc indistinguendum CM1-VF10]|jgi:macrodomain Ter protein organizer (MatP/YcbG family)|nr:hypothetical protein [Nostoc indistinguendum CM1-VF10]